MTPSFMTRIAIPLSAVLAFAGCRDAARITQPPVGLTASLTAISAATRQRR